MHDRAGNGRGSISLQLALLALVAIALLAGILPAGLVLDRWVARELEARVWREVAVAPAILSDRTDAIGSALMMHAKDLAHATALVDALALRDRDRALRVADELARAQGQQVVVVAGDGAVWRGPRAMASLIDATRRNEMPVEVVSDGPSLFLVSLAPVERAGRWIGAAGVASPLDDAAASALAGLTRSDLVLLLGSEGAPPVSSSDSLRAAAIARAIARDGAGGGPREIRVDGVRYLVATGPLAGATVAFVRDLRRELAILPRLRNVLAASGAAALAVALLLGTFLALFLTRPVRALAAAADRVSGGDFGAPLAASPVREVQRVTQAFAAMRTTLSLRIEQLRTANRMLEERQARLAAMQSELIRRERMAVSGRMAVELAHEIRNPVANLRNCLELLYRRLESDPQGREFASLAIDELLRMHELAERMLDLNRPRDSSVGQSDVAEVAREVAALTRLGGEPSVEINVREHGTAHASIPPDALKQVLLNLVQNAREAMPRGLVIDVDVGSSDGVTSISVADNGPGVPPEIRASIFDPFFTARAPAGGTGLGLFMVEGVVTAHGGTVELVDEADRRGARFRITLPAAQPPFATHASGNTKARP